MNLKLQRFDYRSSRYERPNQDWVCGRLAQGKPCRTGPSGGGTCRGGSDCRPLRKGDRWYCTRSDAAGGKCSEGPLPNGACAHPIPPCSPRPSIRRRRGILTRYAVAVTIGLLLVLGAGSAGDALINPGPLSAGHSEIGNCVSCHSVADNGAMGWVTAMFDPHTEAKDVQNCVSCHNERDGLPHNQSAEALAALTDKAQARNLPSSPPMFTRVSSTLGFEVRNSENGQPACRTCHQEHNGNSANLSALSNTECQACHTTKFSSFADGHPDFGDYPYERRTRINFDHNSHIAKYFQDGTFADRAPETCRSCHEPDDQGKLMVFGGFEANCASCHGEFIQNEPAVALALPGMDVYTFEDLEIGIGEWPEFADASGISPIAEVLLADDAAYQEARAALEEGGVDPYDLIDEEEEVVEQAAAVAWAVKGLIYDILVEGPDFIRDRLEAANGATMTSTEIAALTGNLHVEALGAVQRGWFPNLFEEVEAHRDGEDVPIEILFDDPEQHEYITDAETWTEDGGWFSGEYRLKYRLSGHADPFMKAWLDFAAANARENEALAAVLENFSDERAPGGCVTCHSIDSTADSLKVNWHGRVPEPRNVAFSEFVHDKHFSLIGDKGCLTCHQLDPDADYASGFADFDQHSFASNFKPLDRNVCADCHVAEVAGNDCTQCHNYHVGEFPPAAVDTDLVARQE